MIARKLQRLMAVALVAVLPAYLAPVSLAQLRSIPAAAKRGELRHVQDRLIRIDDKPALLAPGAQIRDPDNRLVLPAALPATGVTVKYLVDTEGMVSRVWIMTRREAAQPDAGR